MNIYKKTLFWSIFIIGWVILGITTVPALADPPPDPWADSVNTFGIVTISTGSVEDAVGAPDGNIITIIGVGGGLELYLGEGEEGTGDLTVTYGNTLLSLATSVDFYDADDNLIQSSSLNLLGLDLGTTDTEVITYDYEALGYQAYSYVRITGLAQIFGIDAIEAGTYLPDSDNDGLPDEWEITYGLDPLIATGDDGPDGDPDSDGLTNLEEYNEGTDPNDSDTDDGGVPDGWEVDNGLDPNDGADDTADTDDDGLTNLQEYNEGTDPNDPDSDNDGMPDGWEVDNGLDPNDDTDASEDPDNDGYTNLEEYLNGTDPNSPTLFFYVPIVFR